MSVGPDSNDTGAAGATARGADPEEGRDQSVSVLLPVLLDNVTTPPTTSLCEPPPHQTHRCVEILQSACFWWHLVVHF